MSVDMGLFFLGTQERVFNSHDIQAISVRGTEVLLYIIVANSVDPNEAAHNVYFSSS